MVALLSSHLDCTCDPLCKTPCRIKQFVLFRILMLRRSATPTETELHFEYSHMVNEAIEMIIASEDTPKIVIPSIPTDDQTLP